MMLAEPRHNKILQALQKQGSVSIKVLSEELDVSRETIRRDINQLATENRLRQIRGGAISLSPTEPDISERMNVSAQGKTAIAQMAASMVPEGASVLLDSGTTTQAVARQLIRHNGLTIYTNDIQICLMLGRVNNNTVHLLGGCLQGHEDALSGWDTVSMVERYYADFAFVGAGAISNEPGLMDFSRDACELRGAMLRSAKTVVVVADHQKMGVVAPVRVSNFDRITHIITDIALNKEMEAVFSGLSIEMIIASEEAL